MHDLQVPATRPFHEHAWQTRSRHPTSEGVVRYQRCHCGSWRALLGSRPALAVETGGRTTYNGHQGLTQRVQARSTEGVFVTPFDYVIVGAGPAGCVLANRLSADPASTCC